MSLLISLIVGLIAGAAASYVVKGRGYGIIVDTIVGMVGGLIGGLVFTFLGIDQTNIIGSILMSFVGAVILLSIIKMVKPNA
jgi:uncharacterized membrane protein YeaQ/YmgE (transglycosylase-associated protein family)